MQRRRCSSIAPGAGPRASSWIRALAGALVLGACPPAQGPTSTPEPAPATEPAPAAEPAPVDTREAMDWTGQVDLPGMPLRVTLHLTPEPGGAWAGTIDIPQQGARGLALRDVEVSEEGLDFVLAPPGTTEERWAIFALERSGAEARGALDQGGRSFPTSLRRLAPGEEAGPRRPQTPKAPFPYATREVTVRRGEVALACTLALPAGEGPHAAVAMLSGSGAQDRDETIFEHRPFAVIADHLARGGIASLRCDDRGVGGSTGKYMETSEEELALDAVAMVDALAGEPAIRGDAIGLLGHSEGAIVAPQAAAEAGKKVAFMVLLAGPAVKAEEILVAQIEDLGRAAGKSEEAVAREVKAERALLAVLGGPKAKDKAAVSAAVEALVAAQTEGQELDAATRSAVVNQTVDQLVSPWFVSFVRSDPAKWLRKAKKIPTLALNGERDLQVRASVNLPAMKKAMTGARDLTTEALPGLNHLFQPAERGTVEEYEKVEVTIDPSVLERIAGWIGERTAKVEAKDGGAAPTGAKGKGAAAAPKGAKVEEAAAKGAEGKAPPVVPPSQ